MATDPTVLDPTAIAHSPVCQSAHTSCQPGRGNQFTARRVSSSTRSVGPPSEREKAPGHVPGAFVMPAVRRTRLRRASRCARGELNPHVLSDTRT